MKKWISVLLALTLTLSLAACGKKKAEPLPGTMAENVDKIMAANPAEFMGGQMPLALEDNSEEGLWALKSFTGLSSAEKLSDVAVYEPMTGSQAFSLVLARVKDAADAREVAQQMKENIDPRKWICVGADQVMAAGYSDKVLFIMVDNALGQTAQSYVDAFAQLCGGELDFTI